MLQNGADLVSGQPNLGLERGLLRRIRAGPGQRRSSDSRIFAILNESKLDGEEICSVKRVAHFDQPLLWTAGRRFGTADQIPGAGCYGRRP